jgi:hypothetical protein
VDQRLCSIQDSVCVNQTLSHRSPSSPVRARLPRTTAHVTTGPALILLREFRESCMADGKMSTRCRSGDYKVFSQRVCVRATRRLDTCDGVAVRFVEASAKEIRALVSLDVVSLPRSWPHSGSGLDDRRHRTSSRAGPAKTCRFPQRRPSKVRISIQSRSGRVARVRQLPDFFSGTAVALRMHVRFFFGSLNSLPVCGARN